MKIFGSIRHSARGSLTALLIITAIICGCVFAQDQNPTQKGKEMAPNKSKLFEGEVNAPEFPAGLEWLNTEKSISLRELRGKIVLLDFWTYCCINCMHIIPDLKKLEAKYAKELVVIGVHSAKFTNEKGTDNIRQAILRYEIEHPVINDRDFEVWQSYTARSWPTLVLINPKGKIVGAHSGEGIFDLFDDVIGELAAHFKAKNELDEKPIKFKDRKSTRLNSSHLGISYAVFCLKKKKKKRYKKQQEKKKKKQEIKHTDRKIRQQTNINPFNYINLHHGAYTKSC